MLLDFINWSGTVKNKLSTEQKTESFSFHFGFGQVIVKAVEWNLEPWSTCVQVLCMFYACFHHSGFFFFFAEFGLNQKDALNKIRMKFFCLSPDKTRLVAVRVGVCFDAFNFGSPIFIMKVLTSPYDCIFSVSEIASEKKKKKFWPMRWMGDVSQGWLISQELEAGGFRSKTNRSTKPPSAKKWQSFLSADR